jgi:integrase
MCESEALALRWSDLHLDDDYAEVGAQLSRATTTRPAERLELKTNESVFATVSGAPVSQRNLLHELDRAQRAAVDEHGDPIFRTKDSDGSKLSRKAAGLPTIHRMRHTLASRLVSEGESVDEVAWTLGHKDGRTTRAVYVHELRSAEQRARRLARAERGAKWMSSSEGSEGESSQGTENETIAYLSEKLSAAE